MKIRQGDKVVVISGNQRGSVGEVTQVHPASGRVTVEGINVRVKHLKKTNTRNGCIEKQARPIDASNVALLRPGSKDKPTRVGYELKKDKKVRISRQASGKEIK